MTCCICWTTPGSNLTSLQKRRKRPLDNIFLVDDLPLRLLGDFRRLTGRDRGADKNESSGLLRSEDRDHQRAPQTRLVLKGRGFEEALNQDASRRLGHVVDLDDCALFDHLRDL